MSYTTMTKDIENFIKQIQAPKISFLGKKVLFNSGPGLKILLELLTWRLLLLY